MPSHVISDDSHVHTTAPCLARPCSSLRLAPQCSCQVPDKSQQLVQLICTTVALYDLFGFYFLLTEVYGNYVIGRL